MNADAAARMAPAPAITERGCALVTGASRGIGAAVARDLAAVGWPVAVNFRSRVAEADEVTESIRAAGGEAAALAADVSEPGAADDLCLRAEACFGRPVLVLVNNAAVTANRPLLGLDDDVCRDVLETNLAACFRLMRCALRPMLRQRFGRIVNVASLAGTRANPGQSIYGATKAGLIGLTKTAAVEVARRGVTVNAVAPGVIDTDMSQDRGAEARAAIPVGRAGAPAEVAACVRFLASEEASYVTGSVLTVDGGLSA